MNTPVPPSRPNFARRAARLGARGMETWRQEGVRSFLTKTARKLARKLRLSLTQRATQPTLSLVGSLPQASNLPAYQRWIEENEPSLADLAAQREARFPRRPKFSAVVPVYNPPISYLVSMIESVLNQTYDNWELCLADGASPDPQVRRTLKQFR